MRSGDCFLEILPDNVSKGSALNEIVEMFNLNREKVIAVGDDMNDFEMLKSCGIAFCPSNGSEKVKKHIKNITCSNEEHVIRYIVDYIENNLI